MPDSTGSKYKDESAEFVKGSNSVEQRPTGDMDGEGLGSTSPKYPKEKGEQEWRDGATRTRSDLALSPTIVRFAVV